MEPIVRAEQLSKRYGDLAAVDGIDLEIFPGECFGFLGPNGAGKTTAVKMISGVVPISGGRLSVLGKDVNRDVREIKASIGVCPQDVNLDVDFSVMKNLLVFSRYFGMSKVDAKERAEELIDFFQLGEKRHQKIDSLSGGLKKRLLIARALVNTPRLLILDEPTTGLDPQARHQMWDKIRELKRSGTTIILTTHYMEEASLLCERIVIIDRGKIVESGSPEALVERHIGKEVLEIDDFDPHLQKYLEEEGQSFEIHSSRIYVYTQEGGEILTRITANSKPGRVVLRPATLEDVFLKLTGRHLRD